MLIDAAVTREWSRTILRLRNQSRHIQLLNMAMSDGAIATFDTKYQYNSWRPETAIHMGENRYRLELFMPKCCGWVNSERFEHWRQSLRTAINAKKVSPAAKPSPSSA
jgi:hypothetical protein